MIPKTKFLHPSLITFTIISLLFSFSFLPAQSSNTVSSLSPSDFENPPVSARPTVWWDWLQGNVNLTQLTRDLEEMKDKGLGGAEIWDVEALRNKDNYIPPGPAFLGPQSVEAIDHAIREAKRLGLRMGIMPTTGWNAGGTWVKPEESSKALYVSKIRVEGPKRFSQTLPFPKLPDDAEATYGIKIPKGPDGLPLYYRNVAVLAFPVSEDSIIKNIDSIVNITPNLDANGLLTWDVPPGKWVILRFVCSNTGQQLICATPNSKGPFIDFLDPEMTRRQMKYVLDKVLEKTGSFKGTTFGYLFIDSIELTNATPWSENFVNEFRNRRGYDPTPFLPVLEGWKVTNPDISQRFIYDLKKTISDLLIYSHYTMGTEVLHEYGLEFVAEAGGPGPPIWDSCPVDALKALGAVDVPRGEFWVKHINLFLIKQIASAAHIYGKKLVDAESFTTWRRWMDGPFDFKVIADRAFCEGLNQMALVSFNHTPPEAGLPGWTFHAGSDFNPNVTWWSKAKPFFDYLARCCYMLRQGLFVGDVCYYYGDKAPNFYPAYHDVPENPRLQSLGSGYDYDVTNTEVIMTRMDVKNGRIVLPDGMSYEAMLLPEQEDMPLEVLQKLEYFVREGATVIGPKPSRSVGLAGFPNSDNELRTLADKLWGDCDGVQVKEHSYGKGKVIWGRSAREILQSRGIGPDFSYSNPEEKIDLDYIHRQTPNEEIYFIRNKKDTWEETDCLFRVSGMKPELWNPETGERQPLAVYDSAREGTIVPLRFSPGGSVFVVFRKSNNEAHITAIQKIDAGKKLKEYPELEIAFTTTGKNSARVWQPGTYNIKLSDGSTRTIEAADVPGKIEITGAWKVDFPIGWSAPPSKIFPKLISWTDDEEEGIKYFSGTATYSKEIGIPSDLIGGETELYLDLGRVEEVADVYLNNQHAGILWKPPFRINITGFAQAGTNKLVIEVTNLWANRLAGDQKLPENKRFCKTNQPDGSASDPNRQWVVLESGLMGPVEIIGVRSAEY